MSSERAWPATTAGRLGLQEAMSEAMMQAVQEALGRPIRSFMSANDPKRHLSVEIFVLGPEANGLA